MGATAEVVFVLLVFKWPLTMNREADAIDLPAGQTILTP